MPSHEALKSLPADALWEFLKWLAYGQGRYVGIQIEPGGPSGDSRNRVQRLAESILRAPKQPGDAVLGVVLPAMEQAGGDAVLVAAVAEYVAARQVALYRDWSDFEPRHAVEVQENALHRIQERLNPFNK